MKKIFKLHIMTIILFFSFATISLAYTGVNIVLSVDSTNLVIGQSTNLSVTISNLSSSEKPEIKNISDFNISFVGTSSSISIINGSFKSNKTYSYILVPLKKGKFVIGPAVINVKGKEYKSNTVVINVTDRPIRSGKKVNKDIFLVVNANKTKVKLNEEIILDIKLYRRIDLFNMSIKVPDLNEFIIKKLTNAKEYVEALNGKRYYVDELKYSLIPTEIGSFTIPPFILYGDKPISNSPIDNFFKNPFFTGDTKHISVASNNVKITVSPLKNNTYAVGDYSFTYVIDKNKVKVGDSITLTFKISGTGDLNFSQNLKLPEIKGIKYYPDKPKVSVNYTPNGIMSSKVEKIAIIPEKKGFYKIPSLKIIFYNPHKNRYEQFKLPALSFKVLPSNGNKLKVVESSSKNFKNNLKINTEESIDTIITNKPIVDQMIYLNFFKILLYYLIPLLILIIIYIAKYFYLVRRANYKKIIQSNSFNNLKKSINKADNIDLISEAIKRYFSEKTANLNHSYTFKEILRILESSNIDKNIIENFGNLLAKIEKYQFAKSGEINLETIKNEIIEIIKKIDKSMELK